MRCPMCSNLVGGDRCSCSSQSRTSAGMATSKVQSDWNKGRIDVRQAN